MSNHQFLDDMVVDQDYQDEDMFSQSEQKDQNLESDIDVIDEEIKRKNERIIELELMLEEKQDWFNLKSQMVKKLEGELNYVHARHPERFTFDDVGTRLVPKSLEQTLKDLEREEREETFRTKYMPVYHRETEVFRKRGKYPTNVPYFNEVSMASEFLKKKYLEAFGECFSFDYKKKSFPVKPDRSPHKHLRPSQSTFIQQEGNRKFSVSGHLGEVELLPAVAEARDMETFSEIPANQSLTGLDDLKVNYSIEKLTSAKNYSQYDEDCDWKYMTSINIAYELKLDKQVNFDENKIRNKSGDTLKKLGTITNEAVEKNWWQGGDSFNMWRTRSKLARPKSPRPSNDKNQGDHANVVEFTNGNYLFNVVSETPPKNPTESLKECVIKRSVSLESVFEGDGTKMRPNLKWRMGDECVSLEKYIHVYTRNPEELYEAVKKRANEKEEEEDYEENELYHEEIKASLIGIDETKMKSNLRILDNFIREEEEKEKAKSTLKQVNTENDDEAIDGTINVKIRAEEEPVLPPDQTGRCYENIDGTVGYEKKMNTSFDIIEEIKASLISFDKNKIKSNLRILDNLIREEKIKEKAKSELKQVHTEIADPAAIDVTDNDKISDEKEKTVLPPDQTGSCYEDIDGADTVRYEKKINTCFDLIFEKPKKQMSKPKLSSEKRKTVNMVPNVEDQSILSNENKEDVKREENKNISFDIMFENPKKRTSKPKLSSEKRKIVNLIPNITDQRIKSNENIKAVNLEEKKINTSFDIMFDSPNKQRTKPKLNSGGRKEKFQLKYIDEKKDKSDDNKPKEDARTADRQIAVENVDSTYKEEQDLKKNVSFDVFFESAKKLKPKPNLSFINRKQENESKNKIDDNEVQKEEKHEKSQIVPCKTPEVNLENGGKLGGKFTNGKLGGKFANDVVRKAVKEIRFRFSFLHETSSIPSKIPVMVRRFNGENKSLTKLNNERLRVNSTRRIHVRVLKVTNTNRATLTGPSAVRSFPEGKISVRRGTDLKINSTKNAKSPNDDSRLPRKRERCTKLPKITRKSRIPVRVKGYVWSTYKSDDKRKIDESRRLLAPLSKLPIPKDKIRRPSDCIIPRLGPNEHLPQIFQSFSKREEQAKTPDAYRNLVSPNPMSIGEKGERTCLGSTSEFLQLPSITTKNAIVKTSYPVSSSKLTRLTQIKERKESLDENRISSPSAMLPPIVDRTDTYINRPLSASGFAKLPPIKSINKTKEMDRPRSSARLSPLFTAFENTENRPLSACGSPKLPPVIDINKIEMCRPTSSLSGYTLLPPIQSYKQSSAENDKMKNQTDREETDLPPNREE